MRIKDIDPGFISESKYAWREMSVPDDPANGTVPGDDIPGDQPSFLDTIKSAAKDLGHEFKKRFPQTPASADAGLPAYYIQNKYSTYPPSVKVTDKDFIHEKNHVWIRVSKNFTEITPEVEQKANSQGFKKVLLILKSKKVPALLSGTKCYVSQSVMDEIMKENEGIQMNIGSADDTDPATELTESNRVVALKKMLVG